MPENETVSIVGRTESEGGKTEAVGIQLVLSDNTWQKFETDDFFFTTKSGVYSRAVNIVTLFQKDGTTKVGQLLPLVPETATKGETGQGHSFEKAVDFTWEIQ